MIDYGLVPEIKKEIEHYNELRNHEDERVRKTTEILKFDEGHILQLTVEVADPTLASIVLGSQFGGNIGIPGMLLTSIRFSDHERKDKIIEYLEEQLKELRGY